MLPGCGLAPISAPLPAPWLTVTVVPVEPTWPPVRVTVPMEVNAPPLVERKTWKLVSLFEASVQLRVMRVLEAMTATRLVGAAMGGGGGVPTVTTLDVESPAALKATTR